MTFSTSPPVPTMIRNTTVPSQPSLRATCGYRGRSDLISLTGFRSPLRSAMESRTILLVSRETVGVLGIVATTRPFNGTIVVVSGSTMLMGRSSRMIDLTNFHIPLRSAMESRTILGPSCETVGVLGISAAMRPLNGMIVVVSGLGILNLRSSCTLTVPDTSMPSRVSMGSSGKSCATAEGSQTTHPSSSTRAKPTTLEITETILAGFLCL